MATGVAVEVAALGIPDSLLVNKLVAVLVPVDSDLQVEAVLSACSRRLPSFKAPQDVFFVPSLPKSASGKVDKQRCERLIKVL